MIQTKNNFIIADNQDITYEGLRTYIMRTESSARIMRVQTKRELLSVLADFPYGMVIIDLPCMDFNGIDDFLIVKERFPDIVWLFFSIELAESFMRRVILENNVGIVMKDDTGEEILRAVSAGVDGKRYVSCHIKSLLSTSHGVKTHKDVLTPTEKDVLRLIAKGLSVKEIATERISSTHTIITHKKNIFRKLEVNSVYEATKYALRAGLVEMAEYYI